MYVNYWRQLDASQRETLANQLETSTEYLRMIMFGHKRPGAQLARKLHDLTQGEVNKHQLRPDIF
ncbi:MAG: hypothetical protein ACRCSE_01720 [Vibrio sp.]